MWSYTPLFKSMGIKNREPRDEFPALVCHTFTMRTKAVAKVMHETTSPQSGRTCKITSRYIWRLISLRVWKRGGSSRHRTFRFLTKLVIMTFRLQLRARTKYPHRCLARAWTNTHSCHFTSRRGYLACKLLADCPWDKAVCRL